jgi:hypothetical protein
MKGFFKRPQQNEADLRMKILNHEDDGKIQGYVKA